MIKKSIVAIVTLLSLSSTCFAEIEELERKHIVNSLQAFASGAPGLLDQTIKKEEVIHATQLVQRAKTLEKEASGRSTDFLEMLDAYVQGAKLGSTTSRNALSAMVTSYSPRFAAFWKFLRIIEDSVKKEVQRALEQTARKSEEWIKLAAEIRDGS